MRKKITTYVDEDVADALERVALAKNQSLSAVAAELLEKGVIVQAGEWGESMVVPLLEEVIRKEVAAGYNRMAKLLVRVGLESGTARGLIAHQLTLTEGMDREKVRRISEGYWADAVRRLKTPIEDMPELLQALTETSVRNRAPGVPATAEG